MKVFVTGADGQLGHDVMKELAARGHQAVGSDLDVDSINDRLDGASYLSLDITDEQRVMDLIKEVRPDALIHCAARFVEVGQNLFVGRTLAGNLRRRADEVVGGLAQFVAHLGAHHVAAVGKDELQLLQPFQRTGHLRDVHPLQPLAATVHTVVLAVCPCHAS